MKDHPILFKSEMIKAILDGRKTQTRRVIKPQPCRPGIGTPPEQWPEKYPELCPYGVPGDRLLIKESYRITDVSPKGWALFDYIADGKRGGCQLAPAEFAKWKARKKPYAVTSGRFMYRSLVRLKPPVTNVRVERVQEINWKDCVAEGVRLDSICGPHTRLSRAGAYKIGFHNLWETINKKRGYGWDQNPYVWVVEFKLLAADSTGV